MTNEGRTLFSRKVINLGIGYSPSDTMQIKVVTHDEKGEELWLSYDDNPLSLVR